MGSSRVKTESPLPPRPAETPERRFCLEDNKVLPPFMQEAGEGEAGKSPTEDRGFHIVYIAVTNLYMVDLRQSGISVRLFKAREREENDYS